MTSDGKLHALYFELGEHQKRAGEPAKAADTFALALYYAKRTANRELVQRCREQVAICNPSHIVCREASAPLFFAQLLMRHPPEDAELALADLKTKTALSAFSAAPQRDTAKYPIPDLSVDPYYYAKIDPSAGVFEFGKEENLSDEPIAWLSEVDASSTDPMERVFEAMAEPVREAPLSQPAPNATQRAKSPKESTPLDKHHVYPFEAKRSAAPEAWTDLTPKPVDDYLFSEPLARKTRVAAPAGDSWQNTALQAASVATLVIGVVAIGFFSVELYSKRERLNPARLVRQLQGAEETSTASSVAESPDVVESLKSESDAPVHQLGRNPRSATHGTAR